MAGAKRQSTRRKKRSKRASAASSPRPTSAAASTPARTRPSRTTAKKTSKKRSQLTHAAARRVKASKKTASKKASKTAASKSLPSKKTPRRPHVSLPRASKRVGRASRRKKTVSPPSSVATARAARKKLPSPALGKKLAKKLAKTLGKKSGKAVVRKAPPISGPSARGKKLLGKKRPPRRPSTVRHVQSSTAPSIATAARAFGITALELIELIRRGHVRALLDAEGNFHVPAVATQKKELAARERAAQRKKKRAGRAPFPSPPRKKAKKKKAKKKRRKKLRPPPPPPPPPPEREPIMPMEAAARLVGAAMRDYVMARLATEREATHQQWHALKKTFQSVYGTDRWDDVFDWLVDEFDLDAYVFDREALRDS